MDREPCRDSRDLLLSIVGAFRQREPVLVRMNVAERHHTPLAVLRPDLKGARIHAAGDERLSRIVGEHQVLCAVSIVRAVADEDNGLGRMLVDDGLAITGR